MTANRPADEPLIGRFVRLDPFAPADLDGLHTALARPEVFAGGWGGGAAGLRTDPADFAAFATGYYVSGPTSTPWTVRLAAGADAGAIVGATRFADLDFANESGHIGWTGYDPRVWGTAVNPETKLLLLGMAFDLGFGRVKLQADSLNERSRAAILKLGATFEGIARRHKRRADGSWRDSAVYSVTIDDWERVRGGLEARLAELEPPTLN